VPRALARFEIVVVPWWDGRTIIPDGERGSRP
jgi:hypothetical protein